MTLLVGLAGILTILIILLDVFETIVLPRRVRRRLRLTRLFYHLTWTPWSSPARHGLPSPSREGYLSFYGPLSLLVLLGVWIGSLIVGYAALQWTFGAPLLSAHGVRGFGTYVYMSGTTLLTLGLGDVVPITAAGRALTVIEVATGFAVLALVIGYLPVLYQAFSRREVNVSLLDARAGSPPSAGALLERHGQLEHMHAVDTFLRDWERWAAELMESHLSYPVLAYYRSQHENQSWVAALTTILDISALLIVAVEAPTVRSAHLTFATARHAAVDLSRTFGLAPSPPRQNRLPPAEFTRLSDMARGAGVPFHGGLEVEQRLGELRTMYEPFVNALSEYLLFPLPPWIRTPATREYWRHG